MPGLQIHDRLEANGQLVKQLINGCSLSALTQDKKRIHDSSNVAAGRNGGGLEPYTRLQLGADSMQYNCCLVILSCQPLISPCLCNNSVQSHCTCDGVNVMLKPVCPFTILTTSTLQVQIPWWQAGSESYGLCITSLCLYVCTCALCCSML